MRSVVCWSTIALRAAFVRIGTLKPALLQLLLLDVTGWRCTHPPAPAGVVGVEDAEHVIDDTGEWLLRRESIDTVDTLDGDAVASAATAAARLIALPD